MQGDAMYTKVRGTTTARLLRATVLAAAVIAVGGLADGCGGDSPTGGVAHLGSTAAPRSSTAAGSTTGPGGGEAAPGGQAVAYAACMRTHGVTNFPDPQISHNGSEVSVKIAVPVGAVKGNPQFGPAQAACRKLLPGGGPGHPAALTPAQQEQYLKAAACIRSHGLPSFPDPTFSGGGVHIDHQKLNESSPAFKTAVHDCESLIPGGVHGSGHAQEAAPEQ
jgi:hypothetical protein